ncbi:MAG: lytic murein transglycosylase B [Bdellovibrio bacteriovorus]
MRVLVSLLAVSSLLLAAGCGSNPSKDSGASIRPEGAAYRTDTASRARQLAVSSVGYQVPSGGGAFSGKPAVERFVRHMEVTHGFDPKALSLVLARAQKEDWIIEAMDKPVRKTTRTGPPTPNGAWTRYRAKFITPDNIDKGVQFWRQHASTLEKASARYGVPPEIIVGIIGVETRWGRVMGKTRIIDALATLAFAYPRRSEYFTSELENFLIMARDEGFDPFKPTGSFAGAMGYGQFMPSSFHRYAVDFTGDGHRDLWNPVDAIGSVANYFKGHGWRTGEPVAVRASAGGAAINMKTGFDTRYSLGSLAASGITPATSLGRPGEVSLLRLDAGSDFEYWLGLHNFYVITRYNHSTYYAMAVYQLGKAVKARVGGLPGTRVAQEPAGESEGDAEATL